jgi:hypothetical protein
MATHATSIAGILQNPVVYSNTESLHIHDGISVVASMFLCHLEESEPVQCPWQKLFIVIKNCRETRQLSLEHSTAGIQYMYKCIAGNIRKEKTFSAIQLL